MPAALPHRWTAAEVLDIPESPPYHFEAVDGELIVSPAPSIRHQRAVAALLVLLTEYVESQGVGQALCAPLDIVFDGHTVVQPDVLVIPLVRGRPVSTWQEAGRLLLAVEVLSPSSLRADRLMKRRKYQAMGTECWIVDLDAGLVERWRPGDGEAEVVRDAFEWVAPGATGGVGVDVARVVAKAAGEVR